MKLSRTVPIERTTLSAATFERLITNVVHGTWKAGQQIPTERILCEQLGIARNSLREALKAMELIGMLESRVGEGTFVCPRSEFLSRPLLWAFTGTDHAELADLMEARALMEADLAGLAASRATPEELKRIEDTLHAMEHDIAGSEAVVVGRSDIVGKPVAMLLLNANATVTVCHSKTHDLPGVCRRADILVAAIGRAGFVTPSFVKPGATVIDVGINRVTDPAAARNLFDAGSTRLADFERRGSVVVGDVHPKVAEVAGTLTPVPGGVGPLTIAMLLKNTVKAATARRSAV